MKRRPIIRVKPREGRRARAGAPWVFSNEIVMDAAAKSLAPGSLVNVLGSDERAFGVGYFNLGTLIAVRLFEAPAETAIDRAFLASRLARALHLRERLFDKPFYRLVHAEGDGLPGLVIDRFGDTLVAQITTAGMEQLLEPLLVALDDTVAPKTVVLRADAQARSLEGLETYIRVAKGEELHRVRLEENGARYLADVAAGQKTGWYFDQRENRAFAAELAKGKILLDAFCYTGGFAILAAKAGAHEVIGLDSSQPALALAEEAAAANDVSAQSKFVKSDAMEELKRLTEQSETFDVVIADPPPFVRTKRDLESGARAYRKLARYAAAVTRKNGFVLLASCSHNISMERFKEECAGGIQKTGRRAALIRESGAGPDHPVHPFLPETAYLKSLVFALD
ncbi:MAG: class I SAM-dependent rRNA methyltransferase [Rhizomicrobium sp.]|jgi:23S rRNA (cytosine1962-C5)-methyltransferase